MSDGTERVIAIANVPESSSLRPGDRVLTMDGRPIESVVEEKMALFSGSPELRELRSVAVGLGLGKIGTSVSLEVERIEDGRATRLSVELEHSEAPKPKAPPEFITEVAPGILKVDLTVYDDEAFEKALERLPELRGIIIDMRRHPAGHAMSIVKHFVDEVDVEWLHIPRIESPGQFRGWRDDSLNMKPRSPQLGAETILLVNPSCASFCESILAYADHPEGVRILGEVSAGTNGDAVFVEALPGVRVSFSSVAVTDHEGEVVQSRGIEPHRTVHQTLEGLRAGRDDLMEAALEELAR